MKVGLVYYQDDPERRIFRKVYLLPGEPESHLDDPQWVTMGCDPARTAVLVKVDADSQEAAAPMLGVP